MNINWGVTLCVWVNSFWHFEGILCLQLHIWVVAADQPRGMLGYVVWGRIMRVVKDSLVWSLMMGIYADLTYHLCFFECMKSVDRFQVSQNAFIYENTRHTSICNVVWNLVISCGTSLILRHNSGQKICRKCVNGRVVCKSATP